MNQLVERLPEQAAQSDLVLLHAAAADLRILGSILGILQKPSWVKGTDNAAERLAKLGLNEEDIAALIAERGQARAAKDWAASDVIRDRLLAKGIVLKDGPKGTVWEFSQ